VSVKRPRETAFAFPREAKVSHPAVRLRPLALDEAGILRALDELCHRALRELHALGEVGDRRLPRSVRSTLDLQQQEMALRCEAVLACDLLAGSQERPECRTERCYVLGGLRREQMVVAGRHEVTIHRAPF